MNGFICQPLYLPWMGYFEMIGATDVFVVFDHVQFEKKTWQQRNRIKTAQGQLWLTVPVQKTPRGTRICDVKISYAGGNSLLKHWETICWNYKKAQFFDEYKGHFEQVFNKKFDLLRDLNVELIKVICGILGVKTKIVYSSELGLNDAALGKTERVVNLCEIASIDFLYDGLSAKDFLQLDLFESKGIKIQFQQYNHPKYNQLYGEFVPYLSIVDLIFNEGEKSLEIVNSGRVA